MSKIFYTGRDAIKENYENSDYTNKRSAKYGSEQSPLTLTVTSEERKLEVEAILHEHGIFASISLDEEGEENINELTVLLNTPKTIVLEKTPGRNAPCPCGSGKKFKKCCG
jgi:SWIM/SEC-C metal-binding protein